MYLKNSETILEILKEYGGLFALTVGIGIVITAILMIAFGFLGVYKRKGFKTYNWVVKLWILYVLGVGIFFSYQVAVHRCVYKAVVDYRERIVLYVYNEYMAPFISDETMRDAIIGNVQEAYLKGEKIEDALFSQLEQSTNSGLESNDLTSSIVNDYVKKYKSEVLVLMLFSANQKLGEKYGLQAGSPDISLEDFNEGVDYFKKASSDEVSKGVQSVVMNFLNRKIKSSEKSGEISLFIMTSIFMLLPLLELAIFKLLVKKGKIQPQLDKAN